MGAKQHLTFGEFAAIYGRMKREQFLSRFRTPFLVADVKGAVFSSFDFEKLASSPHADEATMFGKEEKKRWSKDIVAPVEKTDRNVNHEGITLGRSPENDVILPHSSVSKLHAFFKPGPGVEAFQLWDAGSSYGTVVDGRKLDPGVPSPVENGTEILFAQTIPATFYSPEGLFRLLQSKQGLPGR